MWWLAAGLSGSPELRESTAAIVSPADSEEGDGAAVRLT